MEILPDDILLEIFVFILKESSPFTCGYPTCKWHRLVHVCRRWRQIIYASPLRLDLQLLCTYGTPVRKGLVCWPTLPLIIDYHFCWDNPITPDDEDNIFTALKQWDRVRYIYLDVSSLLGELFAVMGKPFPVLTHLWLSCEDMNAPVIPSEFLGGSAPRLHDISFSGIPFLAIPTFLSSARDLVKLRLDYIPPSAFPSPEAMVTCLASLIKLETIFMRFRSPTTRPDRISLPPMTSVVLPCVTSFSFKRDNAYLKDFVTRINAPRLKSISITYAEDLDLQATELSGFIERSNLRPSRSGYAEILFEADRTYFFFYPEVNPTDSVITIEIPSLEELPGVQVADMTKVLSQASALLSDVVHLKIDSNDPRAIGEDDDRGNIRWLELFRPFIAVETLGISFQYVESVAHAFEEIPVEMVNQMFPALRSLHLEGPFMMSTIEGLSNTFRRTCGGPLIITSDIRRTSR